MNRQWINFLPLFSIYLLIILLFDKGELTGDEIRYVGYANNITNGTYLNEEFPTVNSGPGYPLFLAPFIAMGWSFGWIKVFNAFFLLGAVWYLFKVLQHYIPFKQAIFISYLFGLFPTLLKYTPNLLTEPLGLFLLTGFIYHSLVYVKEKNFFSREVLIAGFLIGYLALTKFIFFI